MYACVCDGMLEKHATRIYLLYGGWTDELRFSISISQSRTHNNGVSLYLGGYRRAFQDGKEVQGCNSQLPQIHISLRRHTLFGFLLLRLSSQLFHIHNSTSNISFAHILRIRRGAAVRDVVWTNPSSLRRHLYCSAFRDDAQVTMCVQNQYCYEEVNWRRNCNW